MKIGSLVECIDDVFQQTSENLIGRPLPIKGKQYTVRMIYEFFGDAFLGLQELHPDSAFSIDGFREIEFPPSLMEGVEECLTQTVEI